MHCPVSSVRTHQTPSEFTSFGERVGLDVQTTTEESVIKFVLVCLRLELSVYPEI